MSNKRKNLETWKEELVGKQFGRLTVIEVQPHIRKSTDKKDGYEVVCKCLCGKYVIKPISSVIRGLTKSCGCLNTEKRMISIEKARIYLKEHPECYLKNKEKSIKALKQWRIEHPEEVKEHIDKAIQWHKDNPEKSLEITKKRIDGANKWRLAHKEEALQNSLEALEKASIWKKQHPEEVKNIIKNLQNWKKENPIKYLECLKQSLITSSSSEERELYTFLSSLNYNVERQVLVGNHYFDFRINNFLIEYLGSIYHYTEYSNLNNTEAKEPPSEKKNKDFHKDLRLLAIKHNYNLIQVWDFDWQNRKEFIKNLIQDQLSGKADYRNYVEEDLLNNDYGFSIEGVFVEPKPIWVSTWYKTIVDEEYTKGKVLIYNSGYTKIE